MTTIYEELSKERKKMQSSGEMPEFFTTAGWQLFKSKYLYDAKTPKDQYKRIAKTAAKHIKNKPDWLKQESWEDAFFDLLWKGWLSPSTPVLANMGTDRGLPVSCAGQYVGDSIDEIYKAFHETAILTKHGFGTAGLLDLRGRGDKISVGGTSLGLLPVVKHFIEDMKYVSQGSARRGSFASYIDIEHKDFEEVVNYIEQFPDDANIGWVIKDAFIAKLNKGEKGAVERYQKALKTKMVTGKGYFFFVDKVNRQRPQSYINNNLKVNNAQLCAEVMLHNSEEYTYTCVLSSMNAALYDEWKDTNAVRVATVFLDCVVSEFIEKAKNINGLQKAVAFTEKGRALGLGVAGFHSYLQTHNIPFTFKDASSFNEEMFMLLQKESQIASNWLAIVNGEPEWCKDTGLANTHRLAIAPTKSTALIMGGISEGINPDPAMTFTQLTTAGEVERLNPQLLNIMKGLGLYSEVFIQQIIDAKGSVQDVGWLTQDQKEVLKTAFEIDQEDILKLAAQRQKYICQGQSLNLFFDGNAKEEYISKIHQKAFLDENILGLYYCYSRRELSASKGECESCQ